MNKQNQTRNHSQQTSSREMVLMEDTASGGNLNKNKCSQVIRTAKSEKPLLSAQDIADTQTRKNKQNKLPLINEQEKIRQTGSCEHKFQQLKEDYVLYYTLFCEKCGFMRRYDKETLKYFGEKTA